MPVSILKWVAKRRRPLKRRKNAGLAATLGLTLGALGVGLYLRSVVDFGICFLFTLFALVAYAASGSFLALLAYVGGSAFYAFHRVKASNQTLTEFATR
jgi:hypothetical protein